MHTAYLQAMSPTEYVWDASDRCVQQCVPFPANIQQLRKAIKVDEHSTGQNRQPDQFYVKTCRKDTQDKLWSHQRTPFLRSGALLPLPKSPNSSSARLSQLQPRWQKENLWSTTKVKNNSAVRQEDMANRCAQQSFVHTYTVIELMLGEHTFVT